MLNIENQVFVILKVKKARPALPFGRVLTEFKMLKINRIKLRAKN